MPFTPVDHDPFAPQGKLTPVDIDPFAPPVPAHLQPINRTDAGGLPMPPMYTDAPTSPAPVQTDAVEAAVNGLRLGTQGAARGVADLVGAPVDLATGAINGTSWLAERAVNAIPGVDGVDLPSIDNTPIGGSQNLADLGSMAAEAAGVPLFNPDELEFKDKLAYNANRYGVNALATGVGLRGPAIARAANQARRPAMADALLQPYETGATKPHVGDVAAGVGSATALTAGQEYLPEQLQGPLSDLILTLLGGAGGATVATTAASPKAALNAVKDTLPDSNVPMMPIAPATSYTDEVKVPVSRGATQRAARYAQENATDPNKARATIQDRAQSFRDDGLPVPTTGTLSGDIGLGAVEQGDRVRNPVPYVEADQKIRTEASKQLGSVAADNAEPRAATDFAGKDAARRREEEAAAVELATETKRLADENEQQLAAKFRNPADKGAASRTLDEVVVDETMKPRQAEKNQKFGDIPDVARDSTPFKQAAARVRESVGALNDPERVLPGGTLERIDALGDSVNFQDLNKLRPELTDAIRTARRDGNYTLADNLSALKREISNEVERIAKDPDIAAAKRMTEEGGVDTPIPAEQAADKASEALRYFADDFAPYFGDGTIGGKLKDKINRDTDRVNTPPSATADRFLNVASGAKEAAADLRRILSIAPDPQKGAAAVRQYVLSDMAKVVDAKGMIDPRRMRDWYTKRRDMLSEFPDLDEELRKVMTDSVNSRAKSNTTAKELKDAVSSAKMTETDIQRGNLSLLLDTSPDVAVGKVFGAKDRVKAMGDIVATLSKDKAASAGWKKAVSEYMQRKLTGTNKELTDGAEGPVKFAAMKEFFDENRETLAKVYSGPEMNAMQKAQKLLEPFGALSRRATVGSPTAENTTQAWRTLEAGLKAYYGVLKGGGVLRTMKLAAATLPNSDAQVGFLVHKMQFDPEVAIHLLGLPLKDVGTPTWNAKLNRLLGYEEASRTERPETETEGRK